MTNDITDRDRIWTDTQEWLDDIDRDGPGVDLDAPAPGHGPVSAVDDDNPAPLPPPAAASPADIGHDDMTYNPTTDDDRPVHIDSAPVDLDGAAPEPAAGNADAPDRVLCALQRDGLVTRARAERHAVTWSAAPSPADQEIAALEAAFTEPAAVPRGKSL